MCRSWKCGSPDASTTQAKFLDVGLFVSDTPVTPQCRKCFSEKLSFLQIPDAPDTGVADEGSGDGGNSSNTGGSSETCCSLTSHSMVDDGSGVMKIPDSSDDDLPIASSSSRARIR